MNYFNFSYISLHFQTIFIIWRAGDQLLPSAQRERATYGIVNTRGSARCSRCATNMHVSRRSFVFRCTIVLGDRARCRRRTRKHLHALKLATDWSSIALLYFRLPRARFLEWIQVPHTYTLAVATFNIQDTTPHLYKKQSSASYCVCARPAKRTILCVNAIYL